MIYEELIKRIEKKRWENSLGLKESEKTLKQEHYDSMSPEQRNAQAYAVFCALEGVYKYFLGELGETEAARKKRLLASYKEAGNKCPCKNVNPERYECEVCRGTLEEIESCFDVKLIEVMNDEKRS